MDLIGTAVFVVGLTELALGASRGGTSGWGQPLVFAPERVAQRVDDPVPRREILEEALGRIDSQLRLVRRRRDEIAGLEAELNSKRRRVRDRLRELGRHAAGGRRIRAG